MGESPPPALQSLRAYAATFEATIDDPIMRASYFEIAATGFDQRGQKWEARATGRGPDEAAQNLRYVLDAHKREFDSRKVDQKKMNKPQPPAKLSEVEALLRVRFPKHSLDCVPVGAQWRFILTDPGKSRMFAVSDTAIETYHDQHSMATSALESGAIAALENATSDQVVLLLADGIFRIDTA